jgi:hypothetical protein
MASFSVLSNHMHQAGWPGLELLLGLPDLEYGDLLRKPTGLCVPSSWILLRPS